MEEKKCKYECMSSVPGSMGPGSVVYLNCPFEKDLSQCEHRAFILEAIQKLQHVGNTPAESLWKVHIIYDIPTAYDIGGELRRWREVYRPGSVEAIRKKEKAFLLELGKIRAEGPAHCRPPEKDRQIDIWEILDNG